jgi:hypothetical protein
MKDDGNVNPVSLVSLTQANAGVTVTRADLIPSPVGETPPEIASFFITPVAVMVQARAVIELLSTMVAPGAGRRSDPDTISEMPVNLVPRTQTTRSSPSKAKQHCAWRGLDGELSTQVPEGKKSKVDNRDHDQ